MSNRINHQPIFLLSSTPWRENSLRVEVFSQDYGRISLLARSARTRGSELRGVLVPFVPISASWFGKEEVKTLHRAEWIGGWAQPKNRTLFSALYINELILKLLPHEDPHPKLFVALQRTFQEICTKSYDTSHSLRHFEWVLLTELGLAPDWQRDCAGNEIMPQAHYLIQPEHSAQPIVANTRIPTNGMTISGHLLREIGSGSLNAQSDLAAALRLTRLLLDFHLPEGIHSRRVLQQLNHLKQQIKL